MSTDYSNVLGTSSGFLTVRESPRALFTLCKAFIGAISPLILEVLFAEGAIQLFCLDLKFVFSFSEIFNCSTIESSCNFASV